MEELLDGVEFGGRERAHRADHSAQQRAEEVPAEGHGLIADPDLDLTAVGRTWLTVHMPRAFKPVYEGGGGGRGEPELRAEPTGRGRDAVAIGIQQANQRPYVGVMQRIRPGEGGPGEVKLHRDRPELMHQLQTALVWLIEGRVHPERPLDSLLSRP